MNLSKKGELVDFKIGKFVELNYIRQKSINVKKYVHFKNQFVKHPYSIQSTELTSTFTIDYWYRSSFGT